MEGVILILAETIVKRLVAEKLVTVPELNNNTNKPEPIKLDCQIIESATQKMCFLRF